MKQTCLLSSFFLQIAFFLCVTNVHAQVKEPYAAFNKDKTVLTFYCDELKSERNGMDVGPFSKDNLPKWKYPYNDMVTKVEFDNSFADCKTLTSTAYWFYGFRNLTEIVGIENLKTDNVTDMSSMFYSCSKLTNLNLNSFNTGNVMNLSSMFMYCYFLTSLDLSSFNTANVTDMSNMFFSCSSLTSLDLSSFNTTNVTDMSKMFKDCSSLTSLDLSGFNTANVTKMGAMFASCSSLTRLDLSSFKTGNVTDMGNMFTNCSGLTSLDLSSFNTAFVTSMGYMFYKCSNLTTIYVSDQWSTNSVNRNYLMYMCYRDVFTLCTSLVGGQGTVYAEKRTDVNYACIDGGPNAPGYFTDINDKGLTGIQSITKDCKTPSVIYNLSGSKLTAPQKGINIIGDKKVIVK